MAERKVYRVEYFRAVRSGDPPRELEETFDIQRHYTADLSALATSVRDHLVALATIAGSPAAINFDGVRIVRDDDNTVLFRTTVAEMKAALAGRS